MKILYFLILVFLTSCGSSDSSESSSSEAQIVQMDVVDNKFAMVLNTLSDLPICDDSSEGRLIYLSSEAVFKYCESSEWKDIEIKEKGEIGETGETGETGNNGLNSLISSVEASEDECPFGGNKIKVGTDDNQDGRLDKGEIDTSFNVCNAAPGLSLESVDHCGSSSDLNSDSKVSEKGTFTTVAHFSDGSSFISCGSSYYDLNFLDSDTSTNSLFYPPSEYQRSNISCIPYYVSAKFMFGEILDKRNYVQYESLSTGSTEIVYCTKSFPD